ncbi:MAG: hypothetical protein ACRC92_25875 [Peptostreptococcaceae bacterium]
MLVNLFELFDKAISLTELTDMSDSELRSLINAQTEYIRKNQKEVEATRANNKLKKVFKGR